MFTKFYDNFKNFMKEYFIIIIALIVILFINFYRIPYDVNMPGGVIDLSDRIEVNGKDVEIEGTFLFLQISFFITYFYAVTSSYKVNIKAIFIKNTIHLLKVIVSEHERLYPGLYRTKGRGGNWFKR